MNTREREVMDALAMAARRSLEWIEDRDLACKEDCGNPTCRTNALRSSVAAYDALLAEGSASSEGAEAVAPVAMRVTFPDGSKSPWADYRQQFSPQGWATVEYAYTHPQPAQGEHEQRSCEGSDDGEAQRASAWLAVVSVLNEVAPTWHRDSIGTGREQVCAAIRALAQRASERRPIADEVVERACEVANEACPRYVVTHSMIRAALEWYESALPRGLPAGSDAKEEVAGDYWIDSQDYDGGVAISHPAHGACVVVFGGDAHDASDVAIRIVNMLNATAQQPSCGQDARDAARYRWLKENAHAGFMQSGRAWAVLSSSTEFRTWEQCDTAIDAAIAAQQRQGEQK